MKIDVVSIFPDYLAPLRLSLVGKAIEAGIVDLGVHDLRSWTHDRHRTVDDTPYGGGAGMVMKPEPWGAALDDLVADDASARLVVLTPAGRPFTQALACELATAPHLVFACGRYEGIDDRVATDAATRVQVDEVSVGDYVLNGGEAAVLVIVEAVVRLLPGVVGNPASLTEESHAAEHDGLLEAPVYTKPLTWRGLAVPEVLLSGHHRKIADWRRAQALDRTRRVRPDLVPSGEGATTFGCATVADAGELLTLQRAAYLGEGQVNGSLEIPPLTESLTQLRESLTRGDTVLVARRGHRLVGSVRGQRHLDDVWYVGRLMVAPDVQHQGLGRELLDRIEAAAPVGTRTYALVTGVASAANLRLYRRRGYRVIEETLDSAGVPIVRMTRPGHGASSLDDP